MADPTTLDELMAKRADRLSDTDIDAIVEGLREQRSRWLTNQAAGTRKLVKAKHIPVGMEIDMSAMRPTKIVL